MKINKPEYFIKLDMYACPRFIDINGIILEKDLKGQTSTAEYPINHFIRKGNNTISIHYAPDDYMKSYVNSDSKCGISVWVKGTIDQKKIEYKVTDIIYIPNYDLALEDRYAGSMQKGNYKFNDEEPTLAPDKSDFSIGEIQQGQEGEFEPGVSRIYRSFEADVPFPEWEFFKADTIPYFPIKPEKYKILESEIWPIVGTIWELFEDKDIDKILPLFEHRSKELDLAFYHESGYSIRSLEHSLKTVYSEGYAFDSREMNQMQLVVSYNEKLVTMVNAGTGNGTVMFYDKELDTNTFYDVVWMKKDGKWIISR